MARVIAGIVGVVALVAIVLVVVNPFGETEEEKALTAVCSAKADIQTKVDELKMITPASFTTQGVQDAVSAIGDDLRTIQDSLPTLTDDARTQVKAANDKFRSQFVSLASQIARSITAEDAAAQLKTAFADLADSYKQAYDSVQCPD